ncbi:hypothetical protein Sango_0094600 [Sesamum angolense]|uniref:Uncharacterized protein n=1 Tax=Sesamum angolense TaxID=2727404 RepID=A0AAE1XE17_9LAMI|nr:hypothetical protein Sango_0094600 [Sesamum angolense]
MLRNSNIGAFATTEILRVERTEKRKVIRFPSHGFPCLKELEINDVERDFRILPSSLLSLDISGCPKLRSLPKGDISCLSSLTELCIGPFSEEVDLASFNEIFQGIQQLHSLVHLELYGWPHFESLPDQLQHLTLGVFRIYNFGMEALPEWIGNLAALQSLYLYTCQWLQQKDQ